MGPAGCPGPQTGSPGPVGLAALPLGMAGWATPPIGPVVEKDPSPLH